MSNDIVNKIKNRNVLYDIEDSNTKEALETKQDKLTPGDGVNIDSDGNIKVISDSVLSDSSENPVQNKVIKSAIDSKADKNDLESLQNTVDNLSAVATSGSYSDLLNKPTKLSDFSNDPQFIDNTVDNLTNYYTKSNLYTKTEIDQKIGAIATLKIEIVESLPTEGIRTDTIYLVPNSKTSGEDRYDEYIYVTDHFEHIGSTAVDLSNYYNKTEVDNLLNSKQDTISTLPIGNGGTGASNVKGAQYNLFNAINSVDTDLSSTDNPLFVFHYANPDTTNGSFYKRSGSKIVTWLQSKLSTATTESAGFLSASDKSKLDGIESGAQVNTITGVKGNSETSYRTGNVNITASNIGLGNVGNFKAVSTVASQGLTDTEKSNARTNIGAGTSSLTIGTSSTTAAAGNHTHSSLKNGNYTASLPTLTANSTLALTKDIPTVYDWAKASTKPSYTKSEIGLGNVGNFLAVSTEASQGLTDTQQTNARSNISAVAVEYCTQETYDGYTSDQRKGKYFIITDSDAKTQTEINDSVTAADTTWSSNKITTQLNSALADLTSLKLELATDANNAIPTTLNTKKTFYTNVSTTNLPSSGIGVIETSYINYGGSNYRITQNFMRTTPTPSINYYVRSGVETSGSITWSDWKEV